MGRYLALGTVALLLLNAPGPSTATAGPTPLTEGDRKLFAWFDGIGLPSCAGKPYLRVRWVQGAGSGGTPKAKDLWELDGFVVAEKDGTMTVLDGDLWPRKVSREPAPGWKGGVTPLDLTRVANLAIGRLKAIATEPGAVEAMDEIYRGIRLRFGDEAQSLAFARHLAVNGLESEAHALLQAARALAPAPGTPPGATFEQIVASQLAEGVIWRVVFDFSDPEISRPRLLERLRGWSTSFPDSPLRPRADDALRVLPSMIAEETSHKAVADADLAALPPVEQARELIWRLRDAAGDVYMTEADRVSIGLGKRGSPAQRLVALGREAAPALVAAVTDERFTRAVLFIRDRSFRRLVVARVGDFARVILETISGQEFWDVPQDEPSMFQHGAAAEVQKRCQAWLDGAAEDAAGKEGGPR